jgi:hypothetical protein
MVPEGRVGRSRGEHEGMFVQIERDPRGTGWHIWLSDEDPRDGPCLSACWDMWADTEQDVWEVLGADMLDVAWIDDEGPGDAVARVLDATDEDWFVQRVSAAGIEAWLHDAEVAPSEVELVGSVAVMPGLTESARTLQPRGAKRFGGQGLFPFVVVIEQAHKVEVEDDQRIDQLIVGDVGYQRASRTLTIASPIPGQVVRVRTDSALYFLASGRRPVLVRRWGRWRPAVQPTVDDGRQDVIELGALRVNSYRGPPRINPSPSRKWLRRFGLPEPYETIEVAYLEGPASQARYRVTSEVVSALAGTEFRAGLYRAGSLSRWSEESEGPEAVSQFLGMFGGDDWWSGDVALLVYGQRGPAVVFPSADTEVLSSSSADTRGIGYAQRSPN